MTEIETMQDTKEVMGSAVNGEAGGSNPPLAAKEEWNEEQGILSLVEFQPQKPKAATVGIELARNPEKKARLKNIFIDVLRSTGLVTEAASICQIPKSLAYSWRFEDVEFASRWDSAFKSNIQPHLEAEAVRRAMAGSDLLMMFLLKSLDRDRYDDKVAEKVVSRPSISIQIRDVDKSIVAIAESNQAVPAIDYETRKQLNGKNSEIQTLDASYESVSNESVTSTTGASKK